MYMTRACHCNRHSAISLCLLAVHSIMQSFSCIHSVNAWAVMVWSSIMTSLPAPAIYLSSQWALAWFSRCIFWPKNTWVRLTMNCASCAVSTGSGCEKGGPDFQYCNSDSSRASSLDDTSWKRCEVGNGRVASVVSLGGKWLCKVSSVIWVQHFTYAVWLWRLRCSRPLQPLKLRYNCLRSHLLRCLSVPLVLSSTSTLFLSESKIFCLPAHQE